MSLERKWTAALCCFLVVGTAGVASAQDEPLRPAKLMTLTAGSDRIVRQFFGQVVARQTVDLAFQVGGQIVRQPVIEGATIQKGALIAELDLEPFRLSLEQARLQKDQADRTVERMTRLSGSTVSQVSRDDADTSAGLAKIALENAEYALKQATLLAPFDGIVATRNVANFTTVSAGTPVVRLHDMSELRIEIDVPEVLFQQAGENPDVELFAQFPSDDRRFPIEVREFNAETSTIGQTFKLTFGMEAPEGLAILPGASVTVFAGIRQPVMPITIPNASVGIDSSGATFIMVYTPIDDETGRVTRTPVTVTALSSGDLALEIGPPAGTIIVAAGPDQIRDGQAVRRFAGFPD